MATNASVGQAIKFYVSKTAAEAVALASSEPGSVFLTELGIILRGILYAEPNPTITIGNANGTISVGGTDVPVKGLGSNAFSSAEFLETSKFIASEIVKALGITPVNRATADASGNDIASTYATKAEIAGISGAMHLIGVAIANDTTLTDGLTTNPITLGGKSVTAVSGDVVIQGGLEFVWTGSKWAKLGDDSSYALKATTLAGYGITDAYTKAEVAAQIASAFTNMAGIDSSNTAGKTLKSIKQVNGVVTVEYQDIQITASQVTGMQDALTGKQNTITATGILKGDGNGGVSAAVAGTDYLAPSALQWN